MATSVKVPPMSTPTLYLASDTGHASPTIVAANLENADQAYMTIGAVGVGQPLS